MLEGIFMGIGVVIGLFVVPIVLVIIGFVLACFFILLTFPIAIIKALIEIKKEKRKNES